MTDKIKSLCEKHCMEVHNMTLEELVGLTSIGWITIVYPVYKELGGKIKSSFDYLNDMFEDEVLAASIFGVIQSVQDEVYDKYEVYDM